MKLLLVEDDPDLLDLLRYALRRHGYQIITATDGQQALIRWQAERPDLVLLDVTLPKADGFAVCRHIRQASATPVILVTARDQEAAVLYGLHVGADDCLTKPFSTKELAARIQAVLRRCGHERVSPPSGVIQVGDLLIEEETHRVTRGGQPIPLTKLEFRLLVLLARNAGRVVPSARLLQDAWGDGTRDFRRLTVHLSHLRGKLGMGRTGPGSVQVKVGLGYTLTPGSAAKGAAEKTAPDGG